MVRDHYEKVIIIQYSGGVTVAIFASKPQSPETRDCTTGYLRLPCPLPIASSNKSLQGKDPLAFPLPDQKCLELGNIRSVFQIKGEILVLKKNVQFLEFFGFTLRFRTFQAKKNFQNFSD